MNPWMDWRVHVFLLASSCVGFAQAEVRFTVTDLGSNTMAMGINNRSEVVGWHKGPDELSRAALWSGEAMSDLGAFQGGSTSAIAINDLGHIAGVAALSEGTFKSFFHGEGGMADLGILGNAWGINNAGQVAGTGSTGLGAPWSFGFVWTGGVSESIPVPPGMETDVRGINDSGMVVGSIIPTGLEVPRSAFYYDGTVHSLAGAQLSESAAYAVNNSGQIVGMGKIGGNTHAVMWSGGGMVDLGFFGRGATATDINDIGQVVGWALSPAGGDDHAFLWDNGAMVDLNALVPAETGMLLTMATGINNLGQIVGYGVVESDQTSHAFILTPVPEPTTMVLFCTLAGLAWTRAVACRSRETQGKEISTERTNHFAGT